MGNTTVPIRLRPGRSFMPFLSGLAKHCILQPLEAGLDSLVPSRRGVSSKWAPPGHITGAEQLIHFLPVILQMRVNFSVSEQV